MNTRAPRNYIIFSNALRARLLSGLAMVAVLLIFLMAAEAAPTRGMVASVHPTATRAGLDVLKSGGNAIDAAVAVGLTLGVVDADNSGIGGGCFMLIRLANGKVVAIDGREMAPMKATWNMFIRDGKADLRLSQTGPLASGVPGEVAAFEYAVKNHGKKKFSELLLPAADIAEKGFKLSGSYASRLKSVANDMGKFESSKAVFFKNGKPLEKGDKLKQPELAATYRGIAKMGGEWFYNGPFAQAADKWMRENGGIMTAQDFRSYRVALRQPVTTTYRGYDVVTFSPPSSGGVHVAQMLNILEHFELKKLDEATRLHVIAEAMKLAFADRAYWLGDPDFVNVPRGLVSKEYGAELATRINPKRVTEVAAHGEPPDWATDVYRRHTTHFSVADAEGNWVACTATVNTSFGSKVVIPGTGVVMNNQMDDFSAQPGVPNAFKLVGGQANIVAPKKRPLSSMSPTIVLKDGQPYIALGASGGPKIISAVLMELVNLLDLGMTPKQALAAPRIHQQWSPNELMIEKGLPKKLQTELLNRGHVLNLLPSMATSQIVMRSADGKSFIGAADPRSDGNAEGW